MRKTGKGTALILAAVLLLSGCGQKQEEPAGDGSGIRGGSGSAMGRYVDTYAELPDRQTEKEAMPVDLVQGEEGIRYVDGSGLDYISADQGLSFQADMWLEPEEEGPLMTYMAADPAGNRLFVLIESDEEGVFNTPRLKKADGRTIKISGIGERKIFWRCFYGGDSKFYLADSSEVFQIDADTGEASIVLRDQSNLGYLSVCGQYLFIGTDTLQIYDLEKKEFAAQDQVLCDFLKEWLGNYNYSTGSLPFLVYQGEDDKIYIVTRKGIYQHGMYGSTMEQIVDGSLCNIGDLSKEFLGMEVVEEEGNEVFLILYDDGTLIRYSYDETVPTVPDTTLRVYSLYDDNNVKLAVSAFQQKHRDLYVKYEVGSSGENGVTKEDALKNLSTELASGKGPDLLVMDGIPFKSYVEKGILEEIGGILDQMEEESFFEITGQYQIDGRIYVLPMVITFPVLTAKAETLEGIDSLETLADAVEQARAEKPEGSLINIADAEDAVSLLAKGSYGAWLKEDNTLDKEALTEFLTQAKRIYDAQMSGLGDAVKHMSDVYIAPERTEGSARLNTATAYYLDQPFSVGMMDGMDEDGYFAAFQETLNRALEQSYKTLPGQMEGAGNPVSLLAVNQASGVKEEAREFIRYALSREFQSAAFLKGIPVNEGAFEDKQICTNRALALERSLLVLPNFSTGGYDSFTFGWPSMKEFQYLNEILISLNKVNSCDSRVYDAVVELGQSALNGTKSIEEVVDEIEKRVQLFLAE